MYLIFSAHYDIRPKRAQNLEWYLAMMNQFPNSYFVVNRDYLRPDPSRWEFARARKNNPRFSFKRPKNITVVKRAEEWDEFKNEQIPSNIIKGFAKTPVKELYNILENIIRNNKIEAALTLINNRTLKEVCNKHNIPVIHNEQGPLRPPYFFRGMFFDFSGVNGDTEFYNRFLEFKKIANEVKIYSREELLKIISRPEQYENVKRFRDTLPSYECGVALQVDIDSNMTAFNEGWTSADAVNKALKEHGKALIRNHPVSSMQYASPVSLPNGIKDKSKDSLEFISQCKKVITINSSVALEALFLNREVEVLGDSPFKEMAKMEPDEQLLALNFMVFSYLIPGPMYYNDKYYKYRIMEKDEKVLYNNGIKLVLGENK